MFDKIGTTITSRVGKVFPVFVLAALEQRLDTTLEPKALEKQAMALVTWVEDEPGVQELLRKLFEHWHIPAQGATSAEAAWELFHNQPTPIALVDLILPGRDGFWFVEQVRLEWPETICLVMTGSADKETLLKCMRLGVLRCFLKPLDIEELRQHICQEVQRLRQERERLRQLRDLQYQARQNSRQLAERIVQAAEALLTALSLHDPATASHCRRVCRYARILGRFLRLSASQLVALDLAARLHDVGKIGIPQHLLYQPGRLGEAEWELVRQHPSWSETIVRNLVRHPLVLQTIRHHHERWDGRGYPDGLAGGRIPQLARILTLVDCYDAMTSVRPYRTPLSWPEACAELERHAGTQFDPELTPVFVRLIHRQPEWFLPEPPENLRPSEKGVVAEARSKATSQSLCVR